MSDLTLLTYLEDDCGSLWVGEDGLYLAMESRKKEDMNNFGRLLACEETEATHNVREAPHLIGRKL